MEVARTGQRGEGPLAELAHTGQSGAGAHKTKKEHDKYKKRNRLNTKKGTR